MPQDAVIRFRIEEWFSAFPRFKVLFLSYTDLWKIICMSSSVGGESLSYSNIWEEEFLITKCFQGIRTWVSDRLSNNEISCSGRKVGREGDNWNIRWSRIPDNDTSVGRRFKSTVSLLFTGVSHPFLNDASIACHAAASSANLDWWFEVE